MSMKPGVEVASGLAAVTGIITVINTLIDLVKKLIAEYNLPPDTLVKELEARHVVTNTDVEKLLELIKADGG